MNQTTTAGIYLDKQRTERADPVDQIRDIIDEGGPDILSRIADLLLGPQELARRAEPSVTEADERVLFEAWAQASAIREDLGAWEAWQARAALASPAVSQKDGADAECGWCNDTGIIGSPPDRYEDCPYCVKARAATTVSTGTCRNEKCEGGYIYSTDYSRCMPCSNCHPAASSQFAKGEHTAATTASAAHHFACPQRGYNPLCKGCEAEREATTASASDLQSALDREFPIPDNPHASVIQRAMDDRHAMGVGWMAAMLAVESRRATAPSRDAAPLGGSIADAIAARDAEIADLRAALARAPLPAQGGVPALLNSDEMAALRRFNETCEDGEGYDVRKEMMRRLAAIGAIEWKGFSRYQITGFGMHVLDAAPAQAGDARDYFAWWTSIETDVRKSMLVFAHREPDRLHALVKQAYEEGQQSVRAAMSASQGKQEAK